jgi:hypothetical protein
MRRLSTFNRLFLVFCILFIAFIIWKVPHESRHDKDRASVTRSFTSEE